METLYLPKELREEFRKIWGQALFGTKEEVIKKYKQFVKRRGHTLIITVGDYCSSVLSSDIKIFDGKIKKEKIKNLLKASLSCSNPAGTLQKEVWSVIKTAVKNRENVFVQGEEDLLVVPCVLLAPHNSLVVYGYPNKGVCLIKVSPEMKNRFKELLKKFRTKPS